MRETCSLRHTERGVLYTCSFFMTTLARYNLHTIKFILLNYNSVSDYMHLKRLTSNEIKLII